MLEQDGHVLGKCRLLRDPAFISQYQCDALFSGDLNGCEQVGNGAATCKAHPGIAQEENPGALAGATGADQKKALNSLGEVYPTATVDAISRMRPAIEAFNALSAEDQLILADAIERKFSAGAPIPAFDEVIAEARLWASWASLAELRAYLLASWEALPDLNRSKFLAFADNDRRAAA
ncbi:hypothetical protein [Rhodobacteraceae bacterium DSL-40]|uniref:hypothetical protein n=1 Tax=Amaricoccus sp. B4 TaxID=3368557 RepID=UPI0013A6CECE